MTEPNMDAIKTREINVLVQENRSLVSELSTLRVEYEDIKERWAIALRTPRKEDLDQIATLKAQRDELLALATDCVRLWGGEGAYPPHEKRYKEYVRVREKLVTIRAAVEKEGK